jgi:hypothetical protein
MQLAVCTENPFRRYRPHELLSGILPSPAPTGLHTVGTSSPLYTYCRSLCVTGGSWRDGISPVAGLRLTAVQAIVHPVEYYSTYTHKQARLSNLRQAGGDFFNSTTKNMSTEQLHVLHALRSKFHERAPGTENRTINSFYCFHGPRREHYESICSNGMVATGAMDAGFFGCGCYTTLNIEYAARYARGDFDDIDKRRPDPADGRYPVVMFAASCGMAYPLTPGVDYGHSTDSSAPDGHSDYFGRPLKRGFDCHVVCVNQSSQFQSVDRDQCQYVEVVIEQESQMLPIAVLWFENGSA